MKFLSSLRRLASALCLVAVAAPTLAATRTDTSIPPPTASLSASIDHAKAHAQREALTPDRLPPLLSSREHLRRDHSQPAIAKAGLAACDATIFANASGSALVTAVKSATTECINDLFSVSGAQGALIFPEAKMVTIANAVYADAGSYAGNNGGKMLQLIMFLRAGYYIQWYNPEVGDYGAPLTNAIRPALNAFAANPRFRDVNDTHGEILSEFVILIDSSGENTSQIGTIKGILDRYGPSYHAYWYMKSAVNSVFTVLFRGHYLDDFRAAVQVSPGSALIDSLVNFVNNNKTADIGSDREYMLQNAAGELARFLNPGPWYGYPTSFHNIVHPKAKGVLDQFSLTGYGSGVFVRMAGVIDYYDNAHCAYFGLCNFASDLEDFVLPAANARVCSPTLKVRSQALTSAQMDWVCNTIAQEEIFFHNKIGTTSSNPVANDFNAQLEMVIFHSSTDYETYAGTIFGIDTNNGGMYLEGDPSVVGNQARFVAYEAEWLRPTFDVWNLTHEYVHYLDGRFIWYGMFGEYPMDAPYSGVWFFEGFGEYMSYTFRNLVYTSAVQEAANPDKFTLSQIFNTVYSTDYARTYQWGYMAVRFMFERHLTDINAMIALTRQGNYNPGYRNWLDSIRNSYNAEFRAWVVCFRANNGNTSSCGGTQPTTPTISVTPTTLNASLMPDATIIKTLAIANMGGGALNWTVSEVAAGGTGNTCVASNLPWLSASPTNGSANGGASSNVTVTFDASGLVAGTYSGQLCVASNDTLTPVVRIPVTLTVTSSGGGGDLVCRSLNHTIAATYDGTYINWETGAVDNVEANVPDASFNPYASSSNLRFYWPTSGINAGVIVGSSYAVLNTGASIGPSSTFSGASTETSWRAGADGYLGFRFACSTAAQCYGYMRMTTTAATGFPAIMGNYCYDKTGAAVTIPGGTVSYTVTPSIGTASGSISPASAQTVSSGATTSFTLTPATGYQIDNVGGTCGGSLSGSTFTTSPVTANCTVIANFKLIAPSTWTVTATTSGGNGSISPATQTVNNGGTASFTVIPNTGYRVLSITGDTCAVTGSGTNYSAANISANCAVTATFAPSTWTVTATTSGGNGSISPATQTVNHGNVATLSVVANTGYEVDTVTGCAGALAGATYTTGPVTNHCTVTARFKAVASGSNGVIRSGLLSHEIVQTATGSSLNIVTSAFDDAGPLSGAWDFNFRAVNGLAIGATTLYNPMYLSDGNGKAVIMQGGEIIGPASTQWSAVPSLANWHTGVEAYIGISFNCNARLTYPVLAPGRCYGYIHLITGPSAGFPAMILDTAFDGDGNAIEVPNLAIFSDGFE